MMRLLMPAAVAAALICAGGAFAADAPASVATLPSGDDLRAYCATLVDAYATWRPLLNMVWTGLAAAGAISHVLPYVPPRIVAELGPFGPPLLAAGGNYGHARNAGAE